ncbi:uncharacterized protein BP5553_07407 [Venustampulla echinocandica]|uniref:Uncharacterized protein n=1 Tax=Venustampulla echinocandica TaxID=2656787 RepID=A0A370TJF3_9HELO|nr:uncharacterized protein BP5553_07407 [Venustampulla echinocandica]RDL35476.1 hypothetical protein BP5553_07407 [Venustampulla echinocandica]
MPLPTPARARANQLWRPTGAPTPRKTNLNPANNSIVLVLRSTQPFSARPPSLNGKATASATSDPMTGHLGARQQQQQQQHC